MNNLPKITIITPSFNLRDYIDRTIHSILEQNYPNLEYIVMDGGSTDGTQEILSKYTNKIIWFSEKDDGLYHAINKGLALATGEIIGYLNSDDLYEPGALLKVGSFFAKHPEVFWLAGKCKIINSNDKEISRVITAYRNFLLRRSNHYKTLRVVNFIPQPSTFWRRHLTERIGGFNERYRCVSDYDYWLRAMEVYRLYFMDDYLSSFRVRPTSKTQIHALTNDHEEWEMIKSYASNHLLRRLYKLHRLSIVTTYRLMASLRLQ